MGKTSILFKKIGDSKGKFHARRGMIKDKTGKDLTEREGIKGCFVHESLGKDSESLSLSLFLTNSYGTKISSYPVSKNTKQKVRL